MLKYTLDEVRDFEDSLVGIVGIPNRWWPFDYGEDCIAAQLYCLGVRTRNQTAPNLIGIRNFLSTNTWQRVDRTAIRPGDLAFQNWEAGSGIDSLTGLPKVDHVEMTYSIVPGSTIRTTGADTGPAPGVRDPLGFWKKTRTIGPWLEFGVRPPYRDLASTITASRRAQVRRNATWLNTHLPVDGQQTGAGNIGSNPGDGIPGPRYWLDVQLWSRAEGLYGPHFELDGVPGPQTRKGEAALTAFVKKQ